MKAGTQFEKLAERIFAKLVNNPDYEKVEHNVNLEGKDGPRQIDVLITSQAAGMEIKTIIECKDYKGKVSVGVIDALHSVMQDVNANKAVAVSSNGFSSTAISKAKRLGISLYTAHEALSEKWKVDIEIPILVTEISSIDANPSFEAYFDEGTSIHNNSVFHVNDTNILDEFANYLKSLSPEEIAGLKKEGNTLCPENIKPPFFIRDSFGGKLDVNNFKITFGINKKYYFGYLNEQEDVLALKDIMENGIRILFKADFLIDYEKNLKKIKKSDIPDVGQVRMECLTNPKFEEFQVGPVHINKIG